MIVLDDQSQKLYLNKQCHNLTQTEPCLKKENSLFSGKKVMISKSTNPCPWIIVDHGF